MSVQKFAKLWGSDCLNVKFQLWLPQCHTALKNHGCFIGSWYYSYPLFLFAKIPMDGCCINWRCRPNVIQQCSTNPKVFSVFRENKQGITNTANFFSTTWLYCRVAVNVTLTSRCWKPFWTYQYGHLNNAGGGALKCNVVSRCDQGFLKYTVNKYFLLKPKYTLNADFTHFLTNFTP